MLNNCCDRNKSANFVVVQVMTCLWTGLYAMAAVLLFQSLLKKLHHTFTQMITRTRYVEFCWLTLWQTGYVFVWRYMEWI